MLSLDSSGGTAVNSAVAGLVGLFFFAVPPPLPYLIRHEGFPKSVLEFLVRKRQRNHDDRKAIDGFFAQGMM